MTKNAKMKFVLKNSNSKEYEKRLPVRKPPSSVPSRSKKFSEKMNTWLNSRNRKSIRSSKKMKSAR